MRYFFAGFMHTSGDFGKITFTGDKLPTQDEVINSIRNAYNYPNEPNSIKILGVHEFRDEEEYKGWVKKR